MQTKLHALRAELETIQAVKNTKYKELIKKVNDVITSNFIVNNARLLRSWADTEYDNDVFFRFEIGFFNETDSKIDWGSEIDFIYESKTKMLSINHGCIGTFDKTNVFQFERAKLISSTYDNINNIEKDFHNLVDIARDVLDRTQELKIEVEIREIEKKIEETEKETISNDIVPNISICYTANCQLNRKSRLFEGDLQVTRYTPKYVFFTNKFGEVVKLKKEDVVNHIYRGYIQYV